MGLVVRLIEFMPFSVYFLSFINYFSMSSLYVLLNFPIPEQVYRYLAYFYEELNKDLLALFGLEIHIRPFGEEKTSSNRALFFDVSTRVTSSHLSSFIFLMGNISLILSMQFLSSCLRKNNFLRKLMGQAKWEMIYGQIINVMSPLVLPWTFVILEAGVRDFKTKISAVCNILVFFMALVFPFYYFFELLGERENLLIAERK